MSDFLPFVSMEFSSALGPTAGRYMVRPPGSAVADPSANGAGEAPRELSAADVLQITIIGAPTARGGLVFRRARKVDSDDEPRDVSILIATLIGTNNRFSVRQEAVRFLDACRADEDQQTELVGQCIDAINLAIRAYRAASRDPLPSEIDIHDAREVRIGYGEPEELARGGWTEAFTPPPPRAPKLSRGERLAPTEVVAQIVGGKMPLLGSEDLALRTMLDLEHGRPRAAALQLRATLDLLVSELTDAGESFIPPRDDLEQRIPAVERLAQLALDDRLDDDAEAEVAEILDRIEDALEDYRAWHTG